MNVNVQRMIYNAAAAAPVAVVTALFGGWDALTMALAGLMAADYLSGLIAAAIEGQLDSRVGWKGALRKALMLLVIAAAALADTAAGLSGHPLRAAVCLYYIGNEGISLLENLNCSGVPIPEVLAKHFTQMREKKEE